MTMIEEMALADVVVTAIGKIERLTGGLVRLTFYSERWNERGEKEHVVALKLVRPIETWPQAVRLMSRMMAEADMPFVAEGGEVKRMN